MVKRPSPSSSSPSSRRGRLLDADRLASHPMAAADNTTGRFLVLLQPGATDSASKSLHERAGFRVATLAGAEGGDGIGGVDEGHGIVFQDLGVAVVNAAPDRLTALSDAVASSSALQSFEPERYVYAIGGFDLNYLRGYRDGVNAIYDRCTEQHGMHDSASSTHNDVQLSWGLIATRAGISRFSGMGIKVAVLDTGLDLAHPDFVGRTIESRSFVDGQNVQDGNGHGTHCCGIVAGKRDPLRLPRFGVASGVDLHVGKVLDDSGQGTDANIIAGIQWALSRECSIISMSLGSPVAPGQRYSPAFQQIARRALERGSVIVVASGNDSDRRRDILAPVSHPANCPSMIAVAAVDRRLVPAAFSNAGDAASGSKIDLAGPGVDVVSAWPTPSLYKSLDGTSMATPHVAGVAALHAESDGALRGRALLAELVQRARPLSASNEDVGAGLVQAPSADPIS